MKVLDQANLFLFVTFLVLTTADQGDCPPWFFPDLDWMCLQQCIPSEVKCSRSSALVRIGNCITYGTHVTDTKISLYPYSYLSSICKIITSGYQITPTT